MLRRRATRCCCSEDTAGRRADIKGSVCLYAPPADRHACSWVLQSGTVNPLALPELTALAQALFWTAQARWTAAALLTNESPLTTKGRAPPTFWTAGAAIPPRAAPAAPAPPALAWLWPC